MRKKTAVLILKLLMGASISALTATAFAGSACAEATSQFSVPVQPLSEALKAVAKQGGVAVNYDPDAVASLSSHALAGRYSVEAALKHVIGDLPLASIEEADGSWTIVNSIVVVAHRDEAEANVVAQSTSSSDRLGISIRKQPRNIEVITSKLMEDQQAQSVPDALRNSGGVVVSSTMVQSGTTYAVRGYATPGIQNGLPSPGGVSAGSTQVIGGIERIEVLKGPDAILAGTGNLGGTVNIVMKRPSADPQLNVKLGGGSYGNMEALVDANNALGWDDKLSGRLIVSGKTADENFGGYKGAQQYLFAPSLRFKDDKTDILLSYTGSRDIQGAAPYTILIPGSTAFFDIPRDQPLISKDQGIETKSSKIYGEVTHQFSDWLTWVTRAQHEDLDLDIRIYAPFAALDPSGVLLVMNEHLLQEGKTDSIDSYLRFKFKLGGLDSTLSVGETYYKYYTLYSTNSNATFDIYSLGSPSALAPIGAADHATNWLSSWQRGAYAQYLGTIGKLHVLAGLRYNTYFDNSYIIGWGGTATKDKATTPNYGIVYDLSKSVSLFASYARGVTPNYVTTYQGERLPDVRTQNGEYGVKAALPNTKLFLTASAFSLRQSNTGLSDPAHVGFYLPGPGLKSTGIDVNLSGEILPGWDITSSVVSQKARYLVSVGGDRAAGQPKLKYSVYSSYRRTLAPETTGGFGLGIFGASEMPIDRAGNYYVPSSIQVDANGFLDYKQWTVNLGVRNIFDRVNYGSSTATSYIPYLEPRNYRLTVSRRFF